MKKIVSLLAILFTAASAFAHPGHGATDGYTITHYFVEPEHVLAMAAGLGLVFYLAKRLWKTAKR